MSARRRRPAPTTLHWPHRSGRAEPGPQWLIVGLGNPGSKYAGTRHNVGYWTINRLARAHAIKVEAKGKLAALGEGRIDDVPVALAKPRTFVNLSGEAVRELLRRYDLGLDRLLVVSDDLDMPAARVRVRQGGGHGGHNGLRSIAGAVGADFPRVRIGIGRPVVGGEPTWDPEEIAAYVLRDPPPNEREQLDEAIGTAIEAIDLIVRDGVEPAMNQFNRQ